YKTFQDDIFPTLKQSCAYSTCHSSPQSDFYLTCGDTPDAQLFNYVQAASFVIPCYYPGAPKACDPATMAQWPSVEQSELLLRPLSVPGGGINHPGGVFFQSRMDQTWQAWRDWAAQVQASPPAEEEKSVGRQFFEANVLPKLIQRGCALEGCHSPDGFNDFRLRSGANGAFAPQALRRNYEALADEFMAFDTVDVKQSRAVKKNIAPGSGGITHRAGPILEDSVPIDTDCPTPFDAASNTRAFCVFKEWHRIERMDRAGSLSAMASAS